MCLKKFNYAKGGVVPLDGEKTIIVPEPGETIIPLKFKAPEDIGERLAVVVFCKACKHWHEEDGVGYCDNPDGIDNYAKPDDYCSRGERKETT